MYNHAPQNYKCPICIAVNGIENDATMISQSDIIFHDSLVTVFIASIFTKSNPGHIIIVPNNHYENLYELPNKIAARIGTLSKKLALALKIVRKCDGVTILQNNEPAGDQHAFHYHYHIFPRFHNDNFHQNIDDKVVASKEVKQKYMVELKKYFVNNPIRIS